jgi:major cell surface glycoprotein (TIGR04216 family)
MVVTGTTNRQPDDNTIVVNLYNEEGNSITAVSTEEWGTDGQYSVTIDTSDVETGTYSLEADTGQNTDRAVIELVESVEEETTEEETEEETTEEETTEEETTEEETEEETTEEETTEEETTEEETEEEATDDSTPGFGALVALVALVAAALLATRRRDE